MMKIIFVLLLLFSLASPAGAAEIAAPDVPSVGQDMMPKNTESLGKGLQEIVQNCLKDLYPELMAGIRMGFSILVIVMGYSLLLILAPRTAWIVPMAGTTAIAGHLFQHTNTLITLAAETVREICGYGKLLCPVLTTALAAQGGITSSAALHTGTSAFVAVLTTLVSGWIIPMIYIFLAFSVAYCGIGEDFLKKIADAIKHLLQWILKTLLMIFTTYMSITGVVSGTTDAAAMKATKVMFSSVVPVVGGILADASESVLISMRVMKNAAGIYGILAVLSLLAGPFIRVGVQYLVLKVTAGLCSLFGSKKLCILVEDFSSAMGLLLAMAAASCILVLVSTVCYLKVTGS